MVNTRGDYRKLVSGVAVVTFSSVLPDDGAYSLRMVPAAYLAQEPPAIQAHAAPCVRQALRYAGSASCRVSTVDGVLHVDGAAVPESTVQQSVVLASIARDGGDTMVALSEASVNTWAAAAASLDEINAGASNHAPFVEPGWLNTDTAASWAALLECIKVRLAVFNWRP